MESTTTAKSAVAAGLTVSLVTASWICFHRGAFTTGSLPLRVLELCLLACPPLEPRARSREPKIAASGVRRRVALLVAGPPALEHSHVTLAAPLICTAQ